MEDQKRIEVHTILQKYLGNYIPTQEITHTANMICNKKDAGTDIDDIMYEANSYLRKLDKEFYALQTVNTKSITNNQIIIALNEIKKTLA